MKKIKWIYIIVVFALLANCATKEDKQPAQQLTPVPDTASKKADQFKGPKDTAKTVISLAQLVMDTIFESPQLLKQTKGANLKKLWDYDEKLYRVSSQDKRFIVTKEINPCCPCSATDAMCCQCLIETDFAAVSDMEAQATLDGTSMKVVPSPIAGIDLFTIPSGTTGRHVLKIAGKSVTEVTYNVTIEGGRIRFN